MRTYVRRLEYVEVLAKYDLLPRNLEKTTKQIDVMAALLSLGRTKRIPNKFRPKQHDLDKFVRVRPSTFAVLSAELKAKVMAVLTVFCFVPRSKLPKDVKVLIISKVFDD
jgi:hypothetical protein